MVDLRNLSIHIRRIAGQVNPDDLEKMFFTLSDGSVVTLSEGEFHDVNGNVVDKDYKDVQSVAWQSASKEPVSEDSEEDVSEDSEEDVSEEPEDSENPGY